MSTSSMSSYSRSPSVSSSSSASESSYCSSIPAIVRKRPHSFAYKGLVGDATSNSMESPATLPSPAIVFDPKAAVMPPLTSNSTMVMKTLASMPVLRDSGESELREGRTVGIDKRQKREAYMAFLAGQENDPPCAKCSNGFGLWKKCISVAGLLDGACANCHYGYREESCCFRKSWSFSQLSTTQRY